MNAFQDAMCQLKHAVHLWQRRYVNSFYQVPENLKRFHSDHHKVSTRETHSQFSKITDYLQHRGGI